MYNSELGNTLIEKIASLPLPGLVPEAEYRDPNRVPRDQLAATIYTMTQIYTQFVLAAIDAAGRIRDEPFDTFETPQAFVEKLAGIGVPPSVTLAGLLDEAGSSRNQLVTTLINMRDVFYATILGAKLATGKMTRPNAHPDNHERHGTVH